MSANKIIEEIQRLVVKTLAVNPAGHNLFLIGGFRYRFLNGSVRRSVDVDYHWEGDLTEKQREVVYIKGLEEVIAGQMEPEAARHIQAAGGAATVFDSVLTILKRLLNPTDTGLP